MSHPLPRPLPAPAPCGFECAACGRSRWWRAFAVGVSLVGTLTLAACGRESSSAGEKLDSAVASTEKVGAKLAVEAARAVDDAGSAVVRTSKDIAITAEVNASLARDAALSALAINVDTNSAHVVLKGHAPDEASRMRATQISQAVAGVASVDNQLQIKTVN